MQRAAAGGANIIDVDRLPVHHRLRHGARDRIRRETWGKYDNRLKIGGVKITIDGSPQGRTAYFTTPYLTGGPAGEKDWRGEPTFPEDDVQRSS